MAQKYDIDIRNIKPTPITPRSAIPNGIYLMRSVLRSTRYVYLCCTPGSDMDTEDDQGEEISSGTVTMAIRSRHNYEHLWNIAYDPTTRDYKISGIETEFGLNFLVIDADERQSRPRVFAGREKMSWIIVPDRESFIIGHSSVRDPSFKLLTVQNHALYLTPYDPATTYDNQHWVLELVKALIPPSSRYIENFPGIKAIVSGSYYNIFNCQTNNGLGHHDVLGDASLKMQVEGSHQWQISFDADGNSLLMSAWQRIPPLHPLYAQLIDGSAKVSTDYKSCKLIPCPARPRVFVISLEGDVGPQSRVLSDMGGADYRAASVQAYDESSECQRWRFERH